MPTRGIYTLANDVVFDQLIALLNSIEKNVGSKLPICVIPYDDRLEKVKQGIAEYPQVSLFSDQTSLRRWDEFATEIWNAHPEESNPTRTRPKWYTGRPRWYRGKLQRKLCAFDGEFDVFAFYEADNLAMCSLERLFEKLETYDYVFDDWEHTKSLEHAALDIPLMEKASFYTEEDIRPKLHCGSFWGSKKGFFSPDELQLYRKRLLEHREVEWINGNGFWDDVYLFNYLTFLSGRKQFNFTLSDKFSDKTGNIAGVDPFVQQNNVLFNEQGHKPIHRIHYMNYSSRDFARLCQGEDTKIRYQDVFLYYRYLHQPQIRPQTLHPPTLLTKADRFRELVWQRLKRI
ncbi:MAG: Npun_R2821/Npun_R2822 family protein [Cyanobacteria bacterium P01_H01_bin.15]